MATQQFKETDVQEAIKRIGAYLKDTKPYLFTIEQHIQKKMPDGVINISIRVFKGKVTDVILEDVKRYVFTTKK